MLSEFNTHRMFNRNNATILLNLIVPYIPQDATCRRIEYHKPTLKLALVFVGQILAIVCHKVERAIGAVNHL